MADITTKEGLYYPGAGTQSSDFIGFSFNGVTHKQLGISRVSDGSRYNEQMLPGFQDKSAQMPGSDYTLYWESFYNIRQWTLNIAFDNVSEAQMSLMRQTFNIKNLANLTFDERMGIHWLAKVQSPPQLKYICFDIDEYREWDYGFVPGYTYYTKSGSNYIVTQHTSPRSGTTYYEHLTKVYKGEGTITFIAYYPFGMSDLQPKRNIASANITNSGDIPMDWYVVITEARAANLSEVEVQVNNNAIGQLQFSNITMENNDNFLVINSKTNLIEGASAYNSSTGTYTATGNVYNQYISYGDFFQIPTGNSNFLIIPASTTSGYVGDLYYRYLYL